MTLSSRDQTSNLEFARSILLSHIRKGWIKMRYEEAICDVDASCGQRLADLFALEVATDRLREAAFYAANRLRKRYQETNARWLDRVTQEHELSAILSIIEEELTQTVLLRKKPVILNRRTSGVKTALSNGFIPWVLFRDREPVPQEPGVYLFAVFANQVPSIVDPLCPEVIDIGMAARGNSSIRARLNGFEQVAHHGWGQKSSGWTYLTEYVTDFNELMNFEGLYVSWREMPEASPLEISLYEDSLLKEYFRKNGRRPRINKQPFRRN